MVVNRWDNQPTYTDDYVKQLPYAAISVGVPGFGKYPLILAKVEGDRFHWVSGERNVLVTRNGRLTEVLGLPETLLRTTFVNEDFLGHPLLERQAFEGRSFVREVDLMPGYRYSIAVHSSVQDKGEVPLRLLGEERVTRLLEEFCHAPLLDWKFTNRFWVDPRTGMPLRSEQHFAPSVTPFSVEILKPYKTS